MTIKATTLISGLCLVLLSACVGGPLSGAVRADIARQMVAQRPALSGCYKDALTRDRGATGKMTLNFTVAPTGAFGNVSIASSSISDGKMRTCVENALQSMRLGVRPPSRPVLVTYPIDFTREAIP
jgi:TonB family protein